MTVTKVISGGQIGADIAALAAAMSVGLQTGGSCPKGWKTQAGPNPQLGSVYGLTEHPSGKYPPRTFLNVKLSDATIRLAVDFNSPGERCTMKAIQQYKKPHYDVPFVIDNNTYVTGVDPVEVQAWLQEHNVSVLNVAGNALVGLEQPVFTFLRSVLANESEVKK